MATAAETCMSVNDSMLIHSALHKWDFAIDGYINDASEAVRNVALMWAMYESPSSPPSFNCFVGVTSKLLSAGATLFPRQVYEIITGQSSQYALQFLADHWGIVEENAWKRRRAAII